MKKYASPLLACFFVSIACFGATYKVDPDHSSVAFTIRHIVSKVTGHFKEFGGEIDFDSKKPETFRTKFTVQTKSIDTTNQKRDEHLRGADFLDVEKHPTMTFETRKTTKSGKNIKAQGDLTLHGVIKPVTFTVEFLGADKDPWGNHRAGFAATTKLNRKDFNIIWNKTLESGNLLLGDEVEINVQLEAIEQKAEKKT